MTTVFETTTCMLYLFGPKEDQNPDRLISKVEGTVDLRNFIELIGLIDLDGNPNNTKRNSVTDAIEDSLENNPLNFENMNNGILVSVNSIKSVFIDVAREPILQVTVIAEKPGNDFSAKLLDGRHTLFAIARYLLSKVLSKRKLNRITNLFAMGSSMALNKDAVLEFLENNPAFPRIKVEFISALNSDSYSQAQWAQAHLDIARARHTNVQMTETRKDHPAVNLSNPAVVDYDSLTQELPLDLVRKIEGEPDSEGQIKSSDIIALALIPLSQIPKKQRNFSMTNIYASKKNCLKMYNELVKKHGRETSRKNKKVENALSLVEDFIRAYGTACLLFPEGYANHSTAQCMPLKPFLKPNDKPLVYPCPRGYILPIISALRLLILTDSEGNLSWLIDPVSFLEDHMAARLMKDYPAMVILSAVNDRASEAL